MVSPHELIVLSFVNWQTGWYLLSTVYWQTGEMELKTLPALVLCATYDRTRVELRDKNSGQGSLRRLSQTSSLDLEGSLEA